MIMNVNDLRTFLSVAETSSLTLAAAALGKSQPSVTRCIQELEATLGFQLLERVGRRVVLSAEGLAFEEEARRLVDAFEDLPARTLSRVGRTALPMTISCTYALGAGLVPHAIALWSEEDRPQDIRIAQRAPNSVAQDLLTGQAQIGLSSLPLDIPGLECLQGYEANVAVALPAHRADLFPENQPLKLADLCEWPLVTMLDQSRLQGRIDAALRASGAEPKRTFHVNSSVSAMQLVRLTGAAALVDPVAARGATPPDIILRQLAEPIPFAFGLFVASGAPIQKPHHRFMALCDDAVRALIPNIRRLETRAVKTIGTTT